MWPEADNLWWEHFDKMVKGWPWLLEDEQYKSICISDDSDCNWSPGAKLHVKQFKPKADSLAFVHIPRTGGGSIELSAVLKGLRWGVCNYWPTEGICNPEIKPGVNLTNFFGQQWFQVPQQWIPDEIPTFYEGHDLFAVVRSPYDRILSEFYWQCYAMEACNEDDKSTLNSASFMNNWIQMHMTTFAKCPKVEKLNAKQPQDECQMMLQGHLIRQSDFIFDGLSLEKPMVEWVLHTENLEEEFASLMGEYNMDLELPSFKLHAAKSSILTVDDLDRKTIELINKVYKRDFKVFGYKMI